MRLFRNEDENVASFLYRIYNHLGCTDLALTMTVKDGLDLRWSSKVRYDYLMGLAEWEYVRGTFDVQHQRPYRKFEFFDNVSHRTILDLELLLDIDDVDHPYIDFNNIEEKSRWVYKNLCSTGYDPVVYFTKNKSYHISVLDIKLREMSRGQRQKFRENLITKYHCDLGLVSDLRTIALEGQKHYRSGKKMERVWW